MAQATPGAVSPPPTFHFSVTVSDGVAARFQEVAGLGSEAATVDYRHGDSPVFSPVTMPGLGQVGNVTLRGGIFANGAPFWSWVDSIRMNTVARGTVTIVLLDASGSPKTTWTLTNAWPTRITGAVLDAGGSEVAVESLEIAFETMATATP